MNGLSVFLQVTTTPGAQAPAQQVDPVTTLTRAMQNADFVAAFGKLLTAGVAAVATDGVNSSFDLLRTAWGLPGAIFRRDLSGDARITELNDALLQIIGPLVLVAMAVALAGNVIQIRRGQTPSIAGAVSGIVTVGIATFIAASALWVLDFPMQAASFIFDVIGAATLVDYAGPGLIIVPTPIPFGGIILGFLYVLVMAYLTYVFYKELAWCGTLLADSALWLFAWLLPWSVPKAIGTGLGMKFIGTVFSPAVALTALRLAAPTLQDFTGGDALAQLFRILYAVVAYEAPGVLAGAIAVHLPQFGDAYLAGRAVGRWRAGPSPSGSGGGGGGAAGAGASGAVNAPRPSSPGSAGAAGGKSFVRGGLKSGRLP